MKLIKVTEKAKAANFEVGQSEILFCDWINGTNPDFYSVNKSKVLRQVDQQYFALATVGNIYQAIEKVLPKSVHNYRLTKSKNGDIYFCTYQEDRIFGFDRLGNCFLNWEIEVGEGHPIYDIKFQEPDFLWLAFPTGQTVTQVSLTKRKEIFRIGDYSWEDNSEPLSYPESIFIKGHELFIPNMGNSKLFKVDLTTKQMSLLLTFEEKIWQYEETGIGTFIITDTGLYEMEA